MKVYDSMTVILPFFISRGNFEIGIDSSLDVYAHKPNSPPILIKPTASAVPLGQSSLFLIININQSICVPWDRVAILIRPIKVHSFSSKKLRILFEDLLGSCHCLLNVPFYITSAIYCSNLRSAKFTRGEVEQSGYLNSIHWLLHDEL